MVGSNDAALCGVHLQLGPREELNRSTELGFTPALEKELDVNLTFGYCEDGSITHYCVLEQVGWPSDSAGDAGGQI